MAAIKQAKTAGAGNIRIQWVRSAICTPVKHKAVIRGLGFTRLNQIIERPDTPSIRGMAQKVRHLVVVMEPTNAPASK